MAHSRARALGAAAVLGVTMLVHPPVTRGADDPALDDLASASGIAEVNESFHAAPADYDADGDQDLLINYHDQGGKLWRNDDGVFVRVSPAAWPTRIDRHDCAWADANLDGRLDAFCTVGRTGSNIVKPATKDNELWLQQADGTFVDHGTAWGVGDPYGRGRATTFIDANGDSYPDLFVGNMLPRADDADGGANGENKLFINDAGERFVPAPEMGLHQFVGAQCALVLDYDADGWQDLYLCGTPDSILYRNVAGTGFVDVTEEVGVSGALSRDADVGDIDGDGDLDLVSVDATEVRYQLLEAARFGSVTTVLTPTDGQETALGDADGDGDLDLFVMLGSQTANTDDVLLLNGGLTFSAVGAPPAAGQADAVASIDSDGDGATEFLVLNGRDIPGPVQLLRLRFGPPPDPPPPVTNLLANPSFELDADADGRPDAWSENPRFTRSDLNVLSGQWAGRHAASDQAGYKIEQPVPVTGGTAYQLSGSVNVPATGDAFKLLIKVQWRGPSDTLGTETVAKIVAATNGWVPFDDALTAPAGATSVRVRMIVKSLSAVIFVDDFSLSAAD